MENKWSWLIAGILVMIVITSLIIWNVTLAYKLQSVTKIIQPLNYDKISWLCVDWYGTCGNIVYDNQSQMFLPEGMLDPGCENACSYYSLRREHELPTFNAAELGLND